MIVRSLELKHFGKFEERSFEFRRGMNLVVGPNEAGKSTVMEAIPAVLFGARNKDRFKPWNRHGASEAALVLEGGDRNIRVERDILSDRVILTEKDGLYHSLYSFEGKASPQGRSSERAEYLEQLTRLLGVAEEDVFRSSLFFGQGTLELSDSTSLADKIKSLLSGFAEIDYDGVLHFLRDDYFSITRKNPWGKDKTKDRELEQIHERIAELEQQWYDGQGALKELEAIRSRIRKLEDTLEVDRMEFAKGERYLERVRKHWHLGEKEETLKRDFARVNTQVEKVQRLEQQRRDLEEQIAKTGLPLEMPADLPLILKDAENVRKELVGLQSEAASLREQLLSHANPPWRMAALLSVILGALGGGLFWTFPERGLQALLGVGLVMSVVWIVVSVKAGRLHGEKGRLKGQAQVLEQQRDEAQSRLAGLDERFERLGMSPSAVEIVKMQKGLEKQQELAVQLNEVNSALKVLEASQDLAEEKETLARKLAVLDERIEKEKPLQAQSGLLSPEELPEAEGKLKALGESIRQRQQELIAASREEAALAGKVCNFQSIEEEGESLREREEVLVRRQKALHLACDLLADSVEEFRQTYLESFAGEIGHFLGLATEGRYSEVRLEDDFSLCLKGKADQWQPLACFSRGTVDAAYFAVRLALTRHLSRGRCLPLLLDDPLVNLDQARLGHALKVLEHISQDHQIVLFSHDERFLKRAAQKRWNVVSLDEPKAVRATSPDERSEHVGQLSFL